MGQEINQTRFSQNDFSEYYRSLEGETKLLRKMVRDHCFSDREPVAGFEIETWLIDQQMVPAPINDVFLENFNDPLASAELAKFNVELNNHPVTLKDHALKRLHAEVNDIVSRARQTAEVLDAHLLMIGTLPTLEKSFLTLQNMSPLNRYRALNEQILRAMGKPIHLNIQGKEHLQCDHNDVMLESAATSFQIHIQVPFDQAHHFYNASIIASAPLVAVCANAPYLFGFDLWAETRIAIFEQSIQIGGYDNPELGLLNRVSFGSGYAENSILQCFEENLQHFPILLPTRFESQPDAFNHLRLHNGTIWRWNRPLVGFDDDGTPHIRIEHRVIPAGPSVTDMLANAAFYYGLTAAIANNLIDSPSPLPFSLAKRNFYQAARLGMNAKITWIDRQTSPIQSLILDKLLGSARSGLANLGVASSDSDFYLDIIRERVRSGRNGCEWQRSFIKKNGKDFRSLTKTYLNHQKSGDPVHQWALN